MIALVSKFGGAVLAGLSGLFAGFLGSDSLKWVSWALIFIGILAAVFAGWYFLRKG